MHNFKLFIRHNLSAHSVCVYFLSIRVTLILLGLPVIMSEFTGSGNFKIFCLKENAPVTYSPPTDSLAVKGEPGTTVCCSMSDSSKILPMADFIILVVQNIEGRGGWATLNSGAQRRHL